jgi:ribokinase
MGRVIVVGSVNVDLVATADRFPRPGETVAGRSFARHPGGKGANQAIAAARMGAPAMMAGAVGADAFGRFMETVLADAGVDLALLRRVEDAPTGVALITVAGSDNSIVVVAGANGAVSLPDPFPVAPGDVVVAQLETPLAATRAAFAAARAVGAVTILNPAPASRDALEVLPLSHVVVVNETELATLTARALSDPPTAAEVTSSMHALRSHAGQTVITTLGARGLVAAAEPGGLIEIPGHPVAVTDTTGAGDCFVGALAAGLAQGRTLREALIHANAAAALSVQRPGAGSSMPCAAQVEAMLAAA